MSFSLYSAIVPQEMQNELLAIRDNHKMDCWRVGDMCTERVMFAMEQGEAITLGEIYAAIGYYAGLSARTVRFYQKVSEFFPPNVCSECAELSVNQNGDYLIYGPDLEGPVHGQYTCPACNQKQVDLRSRYDVLAFRHFALAAQEKNQRRWREVLDWCMENGSDGSPASVDYAEQFWSGKVATVANAGETIAVDLDGKGDGAATLPGVGVTSILHNVSVYLHRIMAQPIPLRAREKFTTALQLIQEGMQDLNSN